MGPSGQRRAEIEGGPLLPDWLAAGRRRRLEAGGVRQQVCGGCVSGGAESEDGEAPAAADAGGMEPGGGRRYAGRTAAGKDQFCREFQRTARGGGLWHQPPGLLRSVWECAGSVPLGERRREGARVGGKLSEHPAPA